MINFPLTGRLYRSMANNANIDLVGIESFIDRYRLQEVAESRSRRIVRKLHGRWKEMEWWNLQALFSIPYFSIPARRIPYDRSTMTDFFNTYVNHLALHVLCSLTNLLSKQPYTTPLDSLTFVIWVV